MPGALLALALASSAAPGLAALGEVPAGGERAAAATEGLIGAPYLPSPLGEGRGPAPDPRFRLDAFDCMTFVETAIALASASSLGEARVALDDIRYAGDPSLAGRNHEVLSQWIPSNVDKGWIVDVTAALAGDAAREATKEFTLSSWRAVREAGRAIPGLPRSRLPVGRFGVAVVPPERVLRLAPLLPQGTVVFVVRADAPDRATRVTHAGLVVRGREGAVAVRHATRSKGIRRVIEEPLDRFVRRQARAHPGWPVDGFAFYAIEDASARIRRLAAEDAAGEPSAARAPPRL